MFRFLVSLPCCGVRSFVWRVVVLGFFVLRVAVLSFRV